MKQGKNPTRKQKIIIGSRGLVIENWLVLNETHEVLQLMHKESNKLKKIYK